jgi:hypothetical protein
MLPGTDPHVGMRPAVFAAICFTGAGLWVGFFKIAAIVLRVAGGGL